MTTGKAIGSPANDLDLLLRILFAKNENAVDLCGAKAVKRFKNTSLWTFAPGTMTPNTTSMTYGQTTNPQKPYLRDYKEQMTHGVKQLLLLPTVVIIDSQYLGDLKKIFFDTFFSGSK
jgi:hypothetical protein